MKNMKTAAKIGTGFAVVIAIMVALGWLILQGEARAG